MRLIRVQTQQTTVNKTLHFNTKPEKTTKKQRVKADILVKIKPFML